MIKIGELAKICNVNIQTLRYYDKMGILCADIVDAQSGYRYYKPEKIQIYQTISNLKSFGFSLEEIRQFLGSSYEERCKMYQMKKRLLTDSIRRSQEMIHLIDTACENEKRDIVPVNKQILDISFEDDPDVIGRWDYCGNIDSHTKFSSEDSLEKRASFPESLYFRPGGSPVWMYFWTKGTLYYMLEKYNVLLPNSYHIFNHNSQKYMIIDWMVDKFTNTQVEDTKRIYRQADTHTYSERETYRFRDNTDLLYTPDNRVLGEWETIDVIQKKSDFTSIPEKWSKEPMWLAGLKLFPRGICIKTLNRNNTPCDVGFHYTAGAIIDENSDRVEHYEIRNENGTDYLILEHKSGDYSYLGKVFLYYVFRRKKSI